MKDKARKTASFFSYAFTPPVMTLIAFVIVANREKQNLLPIIFLALIFGVVLPIGVFIYLRKKKLVVNDDATIKEERTIPYLIGAGLTLIALIINILFFGFDLSARVWLIYLFTSLIITLINKFWKISAHAMGTGIPLGISLALGSGFSYFFLAALVIVFWARLTLKVHTPAQLIGGALLGSALAILILTLR